MFELGINTNCQCGANYDEVLDNIKKVGFEVVMVAFNMQDDEHKIVKAKELGLKIAYVHLHYQYANTMWAKGKSADEYTNNVISQIELCGKYEIKKVVFHSTWGSPTDIAAKPNKNGLINFKRILEVAEKNNIQIAVENCDTKGIKHIKYLFKKIKSPNLQFCFDIGHDNLYSKKMNLLKKFGKKLIAIHLHDNMGDYKKGMDYTRDMHIFPFDGTTNYEKKCKQIANTNYDDSILVELHKRGLCVPPSYDKMSNIDYLTEAYKRAQKVKDMILSYKKN